MMTTIDRDFDDEKTLPPLRREEPAERRLSLPGAAGDFRTYETTFAGVATGKIFEARLLSDRGAVAHFAFDVEMAGHLARELQRQLAEPYYGNRFLTSRPAAPRSVPLAFRGTDAFFPIEDAPRVRVEQESGGDRIVLTAYSDEASLHITMQVGVATALQEFLSGAPGGGGR